MYRRPLIAAVAAVALAVTACSTTPAANNSGS
jgi:predicted small secreted protein